MHPDAQAKSLGDYLEIARFLVPDVEEMNRPTIRHPDLSPGNIFVSDNGEITGLIDWQHCAVLPLFLQAGIPNHFQNYGDESSEKLHPPKLPDNFASLSDEDKVVQQELYRKRQMHFFYCGATVYLNSRHHQALGFDPYTYRKTLYTAACSPWEGDNTSLKAHITPVTTHWSPLHSQEAPAECPIQYSEKEVQECLERHEKQEKIDQDLQKMLNYLELSPEGHVDSHSYDDAKEMVDKIKAQWIAESETEFERKDIEDNFPLQDHEELD